MLTPGDGEDINGRENTKSNTANNGITHRRCKSERGTMMYRTADRNTGEDQKQEGTNRTKKNENQNGG